MSKPVQSNKLHSVVNVKTNCGCAPVRAKKRCVQKKRCAFVECVQGEIFQTSESGPCVYFRSVDVRPFAVVKIKNEGSCEMIVIIHSKHKEISETVLQGQDVSFLVPEIAKLMIVCDCNCEKVCRGKYEIKLSSH